jgi:hypothetical protein
MAHTLPTIADFRARYPVRFTEAIASDALVQMALDRGARNVDTTWTEGDYAEAIMLYAAGWLTTQGIGGGAEAQAAANGASGFKVMKSGALTLERFDKGDGASTGGDPVLATADGQAFAALRKQNLGGPRVTGGACGGYVPAGYCGLVGGGWPWGC